MGGSPRPAAAAMAAGGARVDPYAVLGLPRDATTADVGRAYRRLALRSHPDKAPPEARPEAAARFRDLARAYEVLRDPLRRRRFDVGLGDCGEGEGVRPASEYDLFFCSFFGDEARASDGRSADYTYYSLANYDRLTLKEEDVPPYMRDIVVVGLRYLAQVVDNLDAFCVALLRHQRVDILYVMVAHVEPLTQKSFDDGYIIHYYDNPLQGGIYPAWSDQNVLGGHSRRKLSSAIRSQRALSAEQFARRQDLARAAAGARDQQAALEERYAAVAAAHAAAAAAAAATPDAAPGVAPALAAATAAVAAAPAVPPCCCLPPLSRLFVPPLRN